MHIIAATFLLPVGVTVYTFVGGIKATYVYSRELPLFIPDTSQLPHGLLPYCYYLDYCMLLHDQGIH